jgi:hypothetical protein
MSDAKSEYWQQPCEHGVPDGELCSICDVEPEDAIEFVEWSDDTP